MGEVIFVIALLTGLVIPFAIVSLWWWFWCMLTIAFVVAVFEIISKVKTGKTISQQFWAWSVNSVNNRGKAWIVLGAMQVGWLVLLVHLAWKMLK